MPHKRPQSDKSNEKQGDLDVINDRVANGGVGQTRAKRTTGGRMPHNIVDRAANDDGQSRRRRLRRPPCPKCKATARKAGRLERHGGRQGRHGEQTATEPDEACAQKEQRD